MRVVADVWQVAANSRKMAKNKQNAPSSDLETIIFCKGNQRFPLEKPSFSASENSVFS